MRKIIIRLTMSLPWSKCLATRMLTSDLFAVANLFAIVGWAKL